MGAHGRDAEGGSIGQSIAHVRVASFLLTYLLAFLLARESTPHANVSMRVFHLCT